MGIADRTLMIHSALTCRRRQLPRNDGRIAGMQQRRDGPRRSPSPGLLAGLGQGGDMVRLLLRQQLGQPFDSPNRPNIPIVLFDHTWRRSIHFLNYVRGPIYWLAALFSSSLTT